MKKSLIQIGHIVKPKGQGFGFDPFFKPDGSDLTLAESKPNNVNARAIAVKKFAKDETIASEYPILNWEGDWQHDD